MLRSILVGLDGSAHSKAAVELGIRWAKECNALLVGLGIIDAPTITGGAAVPLGAGAFKEHRDERLLKKARLKVEQFLEAFSLRCAEAAVSSKVLEEVGLPGEQIVEEAQRYDLILLGQETYFHFETEEGPDDTLRELLKSNPHPVVCVPKKVPRGQSVLIAYDGSLQSSRALQMYQLMGFDQAGEVHVLTIHEKKAEAVRRADRAVEFLGFHDVQAERHALAESKSPAGMILDQISKLKAGLLVMGAYGNSSVREFFFGSVTRTLLEKSPVPLFLYH